ncbi:sensor domain-containing phosphodiesterase [Hoeflea olei]|uniref:Diguanylate cyclase n=1 Tax=Hoeflea olei TaxID=1480615 RepID=A0A1C1YVM9_9HYPH|nr:EAL domain-containing protein [Hoeflea olei]OCW57507.1 hypothetical protein AWJ14_13205 [Hoeflea olei]
MSRAAQPPAARKKLEEPYRGFPVPANEAERLEAVHRLNILDTAPTPEFDAIVKMAATIFDAPIAMITFLDRDFRWCKAQIGGGLPKLRREHAFCNYTILDTTPFEIEDTLADQRFRNNPSVAGPPHLRYYIGIPVSLDGSTNVTTLCVLDTKPRKATPGQLEQFEQLRTVLTGLVASHDSAQKARTAEQHARQRAMLLSQVEKIAKIGAWSFDTETGAVDWSPQMFALHELPGDEVPSFADAIGYFADHERERVDAKIANCIERGEPFELEADFLSARGNLKRVRAIGEIQHRDDRPPCLVGICKDITEQYEQTRRLWRAAHLDSLTGIANRHSFQSEIDQRLAGCPSAAAPALLVLDVDNFKDINDEFGHLAGDEILRAVARRIAGAVPPEAFCARLGGDEFAILIDTAGDKESGRILAEELVARITAPILYDQREIRVSVSIGIAASPAQVTTGDELFLQADMALYHVKQNGRGRIQIYEPAITQAIEDKRRSVALIRAAIADAGLEPFYQPIVDLATQRIRGVEALARIRNADGSILGPGDFWHALLDPQCAREIDEVILARALRDFAQWRAEGRDIAFVGVNASSASIQSGNFTDRVFAELARNGLSARDLKIEVVESVFLDQGSFDVRAVLEELSARGAQIALDDFGTGYASLSHLRDYPIDCIKIDKSFVQGLGRNTCNTAIVQALIGLGKAMTLHVVAEGIETHGQLDFVSALGANFGQGYLFAKPMDAAATALVLPSARADNLSGPLPATRWRA